MKQMTLYKHLTFDNTAVWFTLNEVYLGINRKLVVLQSFFIFYVVNSKCDIAVLHAKLVLVI